MFSSMRYYIIFVAQCIILLFCLFARELNFCVVCCGFYFILSFFFFFVCTLLKRYAFVKRLLVILFFHLLYTTMPKPRKNILYFCIYLYFFLISSYAHTHNNICKCKYWIRNDLVAFYWWNEIYAKYTSYDTFNNLLHFLYPSISAYNIFKYFSVAERERERDNDGEWPWKKSSILTIFSLCSQYSIWFLWFNIENRHKTEDKTKK